MAPQARRRIRAWSSAVILASVISIVAVAATHDDASSPWEGTPGIFAVDRLDATARTIPVSGAAAVWETSPHDAEVASPWLLSLDGPWNFRWSSDLASAPASFSDPAADASGWDVVEVPHQWQFDGYGDDETGDIAYINERYPWQGYGELAPGELPDEGASIGSYRRTFDVPTTWDGRRTVLAFQGVKSAFTVWVNGVEVGYSEDSYSPAEFDITDALTAGENTIAVRVHRWSDGSWLENQDMIDLSGIFRDVEVYSTPTVHLDDHAIVTEFDDAFVDATLTANVEVARYDAVADADTVRATLVSAAGEVVGTDEADLGAPGDDAVERTLTIAVPDAAPWSAESPTLYTLVYEILDGDAVIETVADRVGFREFAIVDGLMTLNGQPLDIKGVNRGEMQPDVGQALTEEQMREDLVLMRQHNITAVRTSHYPASPTLYRLADEIGMYVMDEANLETHDERPFPGESPEWSAAVLDRIHSLYERDKNHASVLWWSLGNEVGPGAVFAEAADWLRATDPSRLVHFQEDSTVADIDGVFYPYLPDLEERAASGGDKPWIMTEYAHAMGESVGGFAEYWKVIDSAPDMQGGFIWDWADQSIRLPIDGGVAGLPLADGADPSTTYFSYGRDWGDYQNDGAFAVNGLVLPDRTAQPELLTVAAVYAPVELLDANLEAGRVELRNEHLFTDLSDLTATWRVEADGVEVASGTWNPSVAPCQTAWVDVPVTRPDEVVPGAEYWLTLSFALGEDTAWADAGHQVAALQAALPWAAEAPADDDAPSAPVAVDEGTDEIRLTGASFSVVVNRETGALTSYVVDGRELLAGASSPDFWRATTQNDDMNGAAEGALRWRDAGREFVAASVTASRLSSDEVEIVVAGDSPDYDVTYRVLGSGDVVVEATLVPADAGRAPLAMGIELLADPSLDTLTWFGLGPQETWSDRTAGALTGVWSSSVADQFFPQVVPQATGNHVGVRWLTLTDASGTGLRISAVGDTLQASALWFSEQAIEAAAHPYELVEDDAVHLTVDAAQQGVGFSWGPPVLPPFALSGADLPVLRFTLSPQRAGDEA